MVNTLIDALAKAKGAMGELYDAYESVAFEEFKNGRHDVSKYYINQANELLAVLITVDNEFQKLTSEES